jgi:hypothetical protein
MKLEIVSVLFIVFGCFLMGCGTTGTATETGAEFKASESKKQDVANLSCLALTNQVGNIKVKQVTGNTLKISVEKILKNGTEELAQEIFEKVKVNLRIDGNTVNIEAPVSEYLDEILAKYRNLIDVDKVNLEINYVLEVPLSLTQFTINTGVGNITGHDLTGVLDLKTGTGNIALNDRVNISGNSTLLTGVGNMAVKLQTIATRAKLGLETQTGNINLVLPQSMPCTLEIEQYMKETQIREINGGGATIKAKAVLGQVKVDFYD